MQTQTKKWLIILAIGLGSFMSALDGSVVNIILPVLRTEFGSNVATIGWVVTIYLLVLSSLMLTFGRLGDQYGHKKIYVLGFGIFIVGSALSGAATSVLILIIFRGLQAIGAAMLAAEGPALITRNVAKNERGKFLGLVSTMTYLGLTVGPVLGGWLTDALNWRWVFYINIPVGLFGFLLSMALIPKESPQQEKTAFDLWGTLSFITGLTLFLLSLNKSSQWGWTSPLTIGFFIASIAIIVLFIAIERKAKNPMLHLGLFKNQLFSASAISAVLNYLCVYHVTFLMPFYLEQGRGLIPSKAGWFMIVQPVLMAIIAPLSGTLSDKIGSRIPGMIGMGGMAAGLLLLSTLGSTTPLWVVVVGVILIGIGVGAFVTPNTSGLMGAAPANMQGIASGILGTTRSVGMVIGIGMASAALSSKWDNVNIDGLFSGVSLGFLIAGIIALIGIITSAIKNEKPEETKEVLQTN